MGPCFFAFPFLGKYRFYFMGVPEANPIEWNLFFWNQVQLDRMDFCSDALLLFRHGTGKVSEIWGSLGK